MVRVTTRDPRVFEAHLRRAARQIPFATSVALNKTAIAIQKYQREHHEKEYEIRRKQFWDRAIKIKPFSTKDSLVTVLRVEPPGGLKRASIVTRHQWGQPRRPLQGRTLAVPVAGGPFRTPTGVIRRNERPKAFQFQLAYRSAKGTEFYRGNRRTWMYRISDGSGMILRRVGPGRWGTWEGVQKLYYLTRQTPVPARMKFPENARKVFPQEFPGQFRKAYAEAMRTAR